MATSITYNGRDLQTSTYRTTNIVYRHLADRIVDLKTLPRRGGFNVLDTRYDRKIIRVTGYIISDSEANLRTARDDLLKDIAAGSVVEKNLDIGYGGSTIRYKATVQSINVPEEHYHITRLPFTITFLALPWGTATSTTTENWTNQTASLTDATIDITGTFSPLPTITFHVDSETDMTAVKFDNNTTNEWIQVSRSFAAGEDLVIDCDAQTVQVDGTDVDFSGVFPSFDPGTNTFDLTVTDTGSFQYDLSISYYPTYL